MSYLGQSSSRFLDLYPWQISIANRKTLYVDKFTSFTSTDLCVSGSVYQFGVSEMEVTLFNFKGISKQLKKLIL